MSPHAPPEFPFRLIDIKTQDWRTIIDMRVISTLVNQLGIYGTAYLYPTGSGSMVSQYAVGDRQIV